MKVFCFHSVRTLSEVPPASAWPSEKHYHEYLENLRVDPSWFYAFLFKAIDHWSAEQLVLTFDDAYRDAIIPAMQAKRLGIRTIVFTSTDMIGKSLYYSALGTMNWPELQWLHEVGGVEIGHHGCSHISWLGLSGIQVEGEIRAGLAALLDAVPGQRQSIAPPHGAYTKEQHNYALECGFDEVFGTVLYPAFHFGTPRRLARMSGYRDSLEPGSEEIPWPWEG